MSLFTSLFSSKAPEKPSAKQEVVILTGGLKFDREIREVQRYQAALEAICGPRVPSGVNRFETARLLLVANTPQDVIVVRVEIRGKRVGYLSREDAALYRRQLILQAAPNALGQCQAVIRGGWLSSDGRKGDYGVWLDLPNWNE